jgi:pyruvate dehydrogenase E2 component (dihydrolipoamide acetyltransferase)
VLCEVETDKATMEYESTADGNLLKILAGEGAKVKVGDPIAVVGKEGEDISGIVTEARAEATPPVETAAEQPADEAEETGQEGQPGHVPRSTGTHGETALGGRPPGGVAASPLARRMAEERGLELSALEGSGPGGRVVRRDIERAAAAPAPPGRGRETSGEADQERIAVSGKRKVIAERLSASFRTAPHYYLEAVVDPGALLAAREKTNEGREVRLSLNAFLIRITAAALRKHPLVNATWEGETIALHPRADIALAVAQPDGLVTPVVRQCESKGVERIDEELKDLVARAREGRLAPEEYTGGTFTISNLGTSRIRRFTAIINPPQSAILAVGEIVRQPVAGPEDRVVVRPQMTLTLSCDHRVLDGAVAAAFLGELAGMIEEPVRALV